MSDEEKLEAAQRRKEKGNAQFKAGKWAAALEKYKVGTATALQHTNSTYISEWLLVQQPCHPQAQHAETGIGLHVNGNWRCTAALLWFVFHAVSGGPGRPGGQGQGGAEGRRAGCEVGSLMRR
jgi:hypothetical protein